MLKFDPKLVAWPIVISWDAGPLLRSFLAPDAIASCDCTLVVDDSGQADASDLLDGAPTVNSQAVIVEGRICPAGTVVSVKLKEGGALGRYLGTLTPTGVQMGEFEGEQFTIEIVDRLPSRRV